MSDLIFYTNGEETSRIPFPTPGTKCPETKLEIKMTETDISKVLIEGDYATIMGVKYKRVEEPQPKMKFLFDGKCEVVSYNKKSYYRFEFPDEVYWYRRTSHETYLDLKLERITDGETHRLLEGVWFNDVKHGKYDDMRWQGFQAGYELAQPKAVPVEEPKKPETLYDIIVRWWGDAETQDKDPIIADLVDDIEKWLPKEQSAAGSQNVYVECSVEGFNDCLTKIKSKLRNKR
jgi:hypothetical protein